MGPFRQPTTPATHKPAYSKTLPAMRQEPVIILPMPPPSNADTRFEMEIYARFMRHLRDVPNSRMEIKILSAIQFTAGLMNVGDALVAKTLTDLGLRAPRRAFPGSFLDFADRAMLRTAWSAGGAPVSVQALSEHWRRNGEDPFAHITAAAFAVGRKEAARV